MVEQLKQLKALTEALVLSEVKYSKIQQQKELLLEMLLVLNQTNNHEDAIKDLLKLIKQHTGVEAVGIRLESGDDYPYYAIQGFPDEFIKLEMFLCDKDNPSSSFECLCGCVVQQCMAKGTGPFTLGGSFYTGNSSELFSDFAIWENSIPPGINIRGVCGKLGYNTIALIPLKTDSKVVGLLQMNDFRKDALSREVVEFFEQAGRSIGVALCRLQLLKELDKHVTCN